MHNIKRIINKMPYDLDADRSFLFSALYEFCEEILLPKRKQQGLTQKDVSKKLDLNQSEISRIERGLVRPKDMATIQAVCNLYDLTLAEKQKYFSLTTGISQEKNLIDTMTSLLNEQTNFIAQLNRSGHPKTAIEHCKHLRNWVESLISFSEYNNKNLLGSILHLLLEESAAWWDIVPPKKLDLKTVPLLNKMSLLANSLKKVGDGDSYLYIHINKGFHEYVKGHYKNAQDYFNKVLENPLIKNHPWEIEIIRASAVIAGKLKDISALRTYEQIIEKQVSKSKNPAHKEYLLEGLGSGYSEIDNRKALALYNKAWEYMRQASLQQEFLMIRKIQLTRSYVYLLKNLLVKREALKRIAESALNEANKAGFVRHQKQILDIIKN